MIRAFLFDLDGVIVDTAKYHYMAWKRLSEELGLSFDIRDNEALKGVSRRRSFEIILGINGKEMSDEEIEACCQKKNDYYLEYIYQLKKEEILPGVTDFMKEASSLGYKIALGSASKNSRLILEKLEITPYFDAVIDGTKVSKAKPDPEVFLKGAEELGVKPEECIVFEDSLAGIMAARKGHMKSVGVANPEVEDCCDYFISGFSGADVRVLVKKVSGE